MPELAEVEASRARWMAGQRQKVLGVLLHPRKRVFRGSNPIQLRARLRGAQLLESWARGKQMIFRFSGDVWLGIHLGMSGELRVEAPDFIPQKHDHLALRQRRQSLCPRDGLALARAEIGGRTTRWCKRCQR